MARPIFAKIGSPKSAFYGYFLVLLWGQLLTSLTPLSLLSLQFEYSAISSRETPGSPDGDEGDDSCGETAQLSNRLSRTLTDASHQPVTRRRRPARGLQLLAGNGQLESLLESLLRNFLVSARAHPLSSLPGCEHNRRNGIGAPLRC